MAKERKIKESAIFNHSQSEILSKFSPEDQAIISHRFKLLSSLAYYICRDPDLRYELNEPGEGWHWNFIDNIIRFDPLDILERPMDESRFVTAHEGGHSRISRLTGIPKEIWEQPGFSFLTNAIEDPRTNNFLVDAYHKIGEYMKARYEHNFQHRIEAELMRDHQEVIEKAQHLLGHKPRFVQAGFEYLWQWYREVLGDGEVLLSDNLPEEVSDVINQTLEDAQTFWWLYPSYEEANDEVLIQRYADESYKVNRDNIWPLFQKLVEMDIQDQVVQQGLQDIRDKQEGKSQGGIPFPLGNQSSSSNGGSHDLPDPLTDTLTDEEESQIEKAIEKSKGTPRNGLPSDEGFSGQEKLKPEVNGEELTNKGDIDNSDFSKGNTSIGLEPGDTPGIKFDKNGEIKIPFGLEPGDTPGVTLGNDFELPIGMKPRPIDLETIPPELREKLYKYFNSLEGDYSESLRDRAEEAVKGFEAAALDIFGVKFADDPGKKEERGEDSSPEEVNAKVYTGDLSDDDQADLDIFRAVLERELKKDKNLYEKYRREVLKLIDKLENKLRKIFLERKSKRNTKGQRRGKRISIKKRIREKTMGIPATRTRAFERNKLPKERDYAITVLVDLSSSMDGEKILETFKALIVLTEVLSKLSIKLEVIGFNTKLYDFLTFDQKMGDDIREEMSVILEAPSGMTDLGWAVAQASERLSKRREREKFLIVLSDGKPEPSKLHPESKYKLETVVEDVEENTDNKLIGLGVGPGTEHVEEYFTFNLANVSAIEMSQVLSKLILDVIENYDLYRN